MKHKISWSKINKVEINNKVPVESTMSFPSWAHLGSYNIQKQITQSQSHLFPLLFAALRACLMLSFPLTCSLSQSKKNFPERTHILISLARCSACECWVSFWLFLPIEFLFSHFQVAEKQGCGDCAEWGWREWATGSSSEGQGSFIRGAYKRLWGSFPGNSLFALTVSSCFPGSSTS